MREKPGPTISARAVGTMRMRSSPRKSVSLIVARRSSALIRLSPYQVNCPPAVSERDSQLVSGTGMLISGWRFARPYWPWRRAERLTSR